MMKSITIEIPSNGTSVQLVLRSGVSSGQTIIVASDDVEILVVDPSPAAAPQSKTPATKVLVCDLDVVLKRLTKLKPNRRATALNAIKTMFQFEALIDDEQANKILEDLRKRDNLTIDSNDKLQILNA